MADIFAFPPTTTLTVEQALALSQSENLDEVLVIGVKNGKLFIRSSRMTRAEALWLLERGKQWSLGE